jgi:uncharacterized SAM-binding protein YcdF (DUF218 family)
MLKNILSWGLSCLIFGALAWLAGLVWFAMSIPDAVEDTTTHTDAIVVLTGGSERIDTGLKLLADGLADRLYVSGVGGVSGAGVSNVGGQLRRGDTLSEAVNDTTLGPRIALGTAANTPGNATETAAWAHAQKIHSIRLVTAGYHMRRSLLELTAAMPDVTIVPHPVFPANVKTDWWRWPGTTNLIAREYTKFLLTEMRQWLGVDPDTAAVVAPRTAPTAPPQPQPPAPPAAPAPATP